MIFLRLRQQLLPRTTTTKAQTSATNNNGTTTTSTTKATTTTTKATQAQKTDYSISFNNSMGVVIANDKTSAALLTKWNNSDITAEGSLFNADYVLVKGFYGGASLKCSNSAFSNKL